MQILSRSKDEIAKHTEQKKYYTVIFFILRLQFPEQRKFALMEYFTSEQKQRNFLLLCMDVSEKREFRSRKRRHRSA